MVKRDRRPFRSIEEDIIALLYDSFVQGNL